MTKAVWHMTCGTIRTPWPGSAWTFCDCGRVKWMWVDSARGILTVAAPDSEKPSVRVIGMHNGYLRDVAQDPYDVHRKHKEYTEAANGYLFHSESWGCPFVVIKVGMSNDVSWWVDKDDARDEDAAPPEDA